MAEYDFKRRKCLADINQFPSCMEVADFMQWHGVTWRHMTGFDGLLCGVINLLAK